MREREKRRRGTKKERKRDERDEERRDEREKERRDEYQSGFVNIKKMVFWWSSPGTLQVWVCWYVCVCVSSLSTLEAHHPLPSFLPSHTLSQSLNLSIFHARRGENRPRQNSTPPRVTQSHPHPGFIHSTQASASQTSIDPCKPNPTLTTYHPSVLRREDGINKISKLFFLCWFFFSNRLNTEKQ